MSFLPVDTSVLNTGNYLSSVTGLPVIGSINPLTSSSFTPKQALAVAATTPVATRPKSTDKTTQIEIALPAPYATQDTVSGTTIPKDSYRNGMTGLTGPSGDNLSYARTLGESEDAIASISLIAEVVPDGTQLVGPNAQFARSLNQSSKNLESNGTIIQAYSRFMLQQIAEPEKEKLQVVETFTSFYAFFYGKRPPFYTYSGTLINDVNHKWTNDLKFFYENYFRGTRAVDLGAQIVLQYDGRVIIGFLVDLQFSQVAEIDKGATFSFDMLVTDHLPTFFSADITVLQQKLQVQLANQAAFIRQQLAMIDSNIPTEQYKLVSQIRNGQRAPNSALKTGSKSGGPPASSLFSSTSQLIRATQLPGVSTVANLLPNF